MWRNKYLSEGKCLQLVEPGSSFSLLFNEVNLQKNSENFQGNVRFLATGNGSIFSKTTFNRLVVLWTMGTGGYFCGFTILLHEYISSFPSLITGKQFQQNGNFKRYIVLMHILETPLIHVDKKNMMEIFFVFSLNFCDPLVPFLPEVAN